MAVIQNGKIISQEPNCLPSTSGSNSAVDRLVSENWFTDSGIIEQTSCLISRGGEVRTVGLALITDGNEIVLEYEELKASLEYLERDMRFHRRMGHIKDG